MEGKKYRALGQDCQAVSDVIGQMLMISIVVLAFFGIALTVFSDEGAVNPPHTPHTDLRENINARDSTVQIVHSGGDAIDLKEIKIVFSVNGTQTAYNMSDPGVEVRHPDGNVVPKDGVFMYGDGIKINTTEKGVNFTKNDSVDMFFIHTPSRQVIQKTVIQRTSVELPYWFTPCPYGSVYVRSGGESGEWEATELVDCINDGVSAESKMVKGKISSETFTFGIEKYDTIIIDPLKKVLLKIVYITHDGSQKDMKLEINVGDGWIKIADLKMYKDVSKCDQELAPLTLRNTWILLQNLITSQ